MRPVHGIPLAEAAHIVGCSVRTLVRYIEAGRLPAGPARQRRRVSRVDAETLAFTVRSSLARVPGEMSYWVGVREAAEVLGVSLQRVWQLASMGFVPAERHASGVWLFRREQLLTVGNSRAARWRPRSMQAQVSGDSRVRKVERSVE